MSHTLATCDPSEAFTLSMEALQAEIYADGLTDGYEGVKPKHLDTNYLQGYVEGTRAKLVEVQQQLDLLLSDSDRYHQIYSAADDF